MKNEYYMWNGKGDPYYTLYKTVGTEKYNFSYHDYKWVDPEFDCVMQSYNSKKCTIEEYLNKSQMVKRGNDNDLIYLKRVRSELLKEDFYNEVLK